MKSSQQDESEAIAAAFEAGEAIYRAMGSPLYAALCAGAAGNREIFELARHAEPSARPVHVFTAVHYLLMAGVDDPLSRYFATLTTQPSPPEEAFGEFARFCREHRDEIRHLLDTRSIQMTYAERCRALLPPISMVAQSVNEPLHLVEIGCSAGVLLTFDQYAYDYQGRDLVGSPNAPLVLSGELLGGPPLSIPDIASRTGIDLHIVDVTSEQERRWMLASTFPELRDQQARLATALDVVARTDIRFLEGDGLALLPGVLAETPDPLCIYHSACLMYWSPEARVALDKLLLDAGREREIYRIALEPSEQFDAWQQGRTTSSNHRQNSVRRGGEIAISRYFEGAVEHRIVARNNKPDYGSVEWIA